jgi:hypothetical protein
MILPKLFSKSLTPWVTAFASLAAFNTPVMAYYPGQPYVPQQPTNYTTAIPVGYPAPYLMPYGYNEAGRDTSQIIMAGVSPSVIHSTDTSFDVLALVRPGTKPVQKVSLGFDGITTPVFDLTHINTLKNGDQLWKKTYSFTAGAYGNNAIVQIKWGLGANQFFMKATDAGQTFIPTAGSNNLQDYNGSPFPVVKFSDSPRKTVFMDTTKNDALSYNTTKRTMTQAIMGGVSPAMVDIHDTSFDIVALLRPGTVPIQNVFIKRIPENYGYELKKRKKLTNGDEIWVFTYTFPAGHYGVTTIPVVWGTGPGEYTLQVTDTIQQTYLVYPDLKSGNFPAQ